MTTEPLHALILGVAAPAANAILIVLVLLLLLVIDLGSDESDHERAEARYEKNLL
jgi:hypothetical protein